MPPLATGLVTLAEEHGPLACRRAVERVRLEGCESFSTNRAGFLESQRIHRVTSLGSRSSYSAAALAVRSGVAPRRIQSGNTCVIHRRIAKPQFEHQTWIEFAQYSTFTCSWAREFVDAKIRAGKSYYTAIRALAYKWIRILYACWKAGTIYDEAKYLKTLQRHQSPYLPKTEAKT